MRAQISSWRCVFLVTSSILRKFQWINMAKRKILRWYVPSTQKARFSWISKELFSYWVSPVSCPSPPDSLLSISGVYLGWEEHTFRLNKSYGLDHRAKVFLNSFPDPNQLQYHRLWEPVIFSILYYEKSFLKKRLPSPPHSPSSRLAKLAAVIKEIKFLGQGDPICIFLWPE